MFLRSKIPDGDGWFYRNSAHQHSHVLMVKLEGRDKELDLSGKKPHEWWTPARWCKTPEKAELAMKRWRNSDKNTRELLRVLVPVESCPSTIWRYRWMKKALKVQFKLPETRHSRTLVMSGEDTEPCAFAVFHQEREREEDDWGPRVYSDIRTFRTKQEMEAALMARRPWRFTTFKQELYVPLEPVVLERYT